MDRKYIAGELLQAAREMSGQAGPMMTLREFISHELTAIGKGLSKNVDVGRRNVDKNPSSASFAPKLASTCRAEAISSLKENAGITVRSSDLKKEWSAYYTKMDPVKNQHKYHFYVVYKFENPDTGKDNFVGVNTSGRIGISERAYDLTWTKGNKRSYPPTSESDAKAAVNKHLKTKTAPAKGYVKTKMTAG